MSGHKLIPATYYFANIGALVILMIATVAAYYIDLGAAAFPVAMAIAICKATLIIMIFMNVRWSSKLTKIFAAAGFFWLLILLGFLYVDYSRPELGHIYSDVQKVGVNPINVAAGAVHDEPAEAAPEIHDAAPAEEPAHH